MRCHRLRRHAFRRSGPAECASSQCPGWPLARAPSSTAGACEVSTAPRLGPGDDPTSFASRGSGVRIPSAPQRMPQILGPVCLPSNRSAGLDPHLTSEPDVISRQSTLLASTEWHRFDAADGVKETRHCSPAMTVHLRWDAWPSTVSRRGPRQAGTGSRTPGRRRVSKIASARCTRSHSASVTGQASHA
jgi:hypothetical protein